MVLRATPVARAVAAMAGAVRLRGHVQSPRPLIKRRTNRFEPQRNGFLVDHPTTLSGSWRGENHPTLRGSYRRAYFWASPYVGPAGRWGTPSEAHTRTGGRTFMSRCR